MINNKELINAGFVRKSVENNEHGYRFKETRWYYGPYLFLTKNSRIGKRIDKFSADDFLLYSEYTYLEEKEIHYCDYFSKDWTVEDVVNRCKLYYNSSIKQLNEKISKYYSDIELISKYI